MCGRASALWVESAIEPLPTLAASSFGRLRCEVHPALSGSSWILGLLDNAHADVRTEVHLGDFDRITLGDVAVRAVPPNGFELGQG